MYLVEETSIVGNENHTKLVVQFENQAAIDQFNDERALWETDEHVDTELLTYAKRRESATEALENAIRLYIDVDEMSEQEGVVNAK